MESNISRRGIRVRFGARGNAAGCTAPWFDAKASGIGGKKQIVCFFTYGSK